MFYLLIYFYLVFKVQFELVVSNLLGRKKCVKSFSHDSQEVDSEDPAAVVRTLCVAVNAYCAQWMVRKAEALAVYVVQYAR